MVHDFALVTAVTPEYVPLLKWSLPSWTIKPQFQGRKLYIFERGVRARDLEWVKECYKDVQIVTWDVTKADTLREKMLSAFVLGAAREVREEWWTKLDADAFCTSSADVWDESDFEYDLSSHKWGYTKPAWWVAAMTAFCEGKEYAGPRDGGGSIGAKRIISFCCLHKQAFVKRCALLAGDRLPIASHDSFLWFIADRFEDCNFRRKNVKALGVDHLSGHKWKNLRERVCSGAGVWNARHERELLENIQIEITTACDLGCPNCDRACGIAPSADRISLEQVEAFRADCLANGKKFWRIDIIGGEPSLHQDLLKIIETVKPLAHRLRYTTNGRSEKAKAALPQVERLGCEVRNSAKDSAANEFDPAQWAPADCGKPEAEACSIPWRCGIALTPSGIYPCGAGASIARVFGLRVGLQSWKEATPAALHAAMRQLCKLCGHSRSVSDVRTPAGIQKTSKSWEEALARYKECPPPMGRIYWNSEGGWPHGNEQAKEAKSTNGNAPDSRGLDAAGGGDGGGATSQEDGS